MKLAIKLRYCIQALKNGVQQARIAQTLRDALRGGGTEVQLRKTTLRCATIETT